ncbi:MAG: transketolase [Candidatus Saganbacteria bacterium]|nr:transketolase [Candidatus Saganbacteria bacterium]
MRSEFAGSIIDLYDKNKNIIFITGDLGYKALENVMATYKERFINAGVAEQNMLSFAAGLAYEGFIPFVYSIAPFALLRPYEQIRNDICLQNVPVKIVGNGGGYGYGIMGPTHHTLEDIAIMRVLPNMKVFVPLLASDVKEAVNIMVKDPSPNYLRLNLAPKLDHPIEGFRQWRKIKDGKKCIIIGTGPILANIFEAIKDSPDDFEIWATGIFPITELPGELTRSIKEKQKVLTIEEHCGQCGFGEALALLILENTGIGIDFKSLSAHGYPSGKYVSQRWHQEENDLAGPGLKKILKEFCHDQ